MERVLGCREASESRRAWYASAFGVIAWVESEGLSATFSMDVTLKPSSHIAVKSMMLNFRVSTIGLARVVWAVQESNLPSDLERPYAHR